MSIVRIGLGETKGYHEGYEAIFKKKPVNASAPAKKAAPAKKPAKQAKKK